MTPPTSADLVNRALRLVFTQKALRHRLRLSKSRMSRIVHGGRLGFERCLLLADLLREDPAVVLQAYRHARLSDILQGLYIIRGYVPRERARVHEALDQLPSDDHHVIGTLIDRLVSAGKGGAR
jgi:hypothetical protein